MGTWGVAIPGLGMAAAELPQIEGLLRLDNPEIGRGPMLDGTYTLEDVASLHAQTIRALRDQSGETFWVVGMSMGAMIAAILASSFAQDLPDATHFAFLVTSPNLSGQPAISDATLASWARARPGQVDGYREVLGAFFGAKFRETQMTAVERYCQYRAAGGNGQTPRAFMRQVAALRAFNGAQHFASIDGSRCLFVGGGSDEILGPAHNADLRALVPTARHHEWPELGHMINIERPDAFDVRELWDQ